MMNKCIIVVATVLFFVAGVTLSNAATYYVDSASGDDSLTGTSEASAWATLSKVNNTPLQPGDTVLLRRGSLWRETLNPQTSGTQSSPIVFDAYGTGESPKIYGSDQPGSIVNHSGNIWYIPDIHNDPGMLFSEASGHPRKTSVAGLADNHEWFYDASDARIYFYSDSDPDVGSTEIPVRNCVGYTWVSHIIIRNIEMGYAINGIGFWGGDFWTIENVQIHNTVISGIQGNNSSCNIVVRDSYFRDWGWQSIGKRYADGAQYFGYGIQAIDTTGGSSEYWRITGNTFEMVNMTNSDADVTAINFDQQSHASLIEDNTILFNGCTGGYGIMIWRPKGNGDIVVRNNRIRDTGSMGINISEFDANNCTANVQVDGNRIDNSCLLDMIDEEGLRIWTGTTAHLVVRNNLVNTTRDGQYTHHGIRIRKSTVELYNNTVYGADYGISIEQSSSVTPVANNISSGNRIASFVIDETSDCIENNNLFHGSVNGINLSASTILNDPLFESIEGDVFSVKSTSPAINAGIDFDSNTHDIEGNPRLSGESTDIGAFEYQGGSSSIPPEIETVTITPSSGWAGIGDMVSVTVHAVGEETGLTASNATVNGREVTLSDQGDGTYTGIYTVQSGDSDGENVEATDITLTGEGGTSASASSSGSTLQVDAHRPSVQSVSLSPSTGWLTAGDTVTITAIASNNEGGLLVSPASLNGIQIPMRDQGGGVYEGQYTVNSDDDQSTGLIATGIVLTDASGNASAPGASTASTLQIDTIAPVIQSVTISPNTGTVRIGETIEVTSRALNNETGLTVSQATINGRHVNLSGNDDGTYTGTYTVLAGDTATSNVEVVDVVLMDAAGNMSAPGSSSGSSLTIDPTPVTEPVTPPEIASVTINPSSGLLGVGDTVTITVSAASSESGLTVSPATINTRQVALIESGNGVYSGIYTVQEGDPDGVNPEATGITLTGAGGTSASASSSGSTLRIDAHAPVISAVELSPSQGWLRDGDTVTVIVRTDPSELGLTASMATVNSRTIPLQDNNDGTYRGIYTVQDGHPQGRNLTAQNITLTDAAGNTSLPASSSVSMLSVDTIVPVISSVILSPNEGQVVAGDQVIVRISTNPAETGLNGTVELNGRKLVLEDCQDGTYRGVYTVGVDDNPVTNVQARNASLTDSAGNTSAVMNSSVTNLSINPDGSNAELPRIASVELSPNRGWITTGGIVQITVKAEIPESGMTVSPAMINGETVSLEPLVIQSDAYHATEVPGTFVGQYVVESDDAQGRNIEAESITITNAAGFMSVPVSSNGSTLKVDTVKPSIKEVKIDPMVGKAVAAGDAVMVTVIAENSETGLIPSDAVISGNKVQLTDRGDGTYTGIYNVVIDKDTDYLIEAENITLTDHAGNVSDPASSEGSGLIVDIPVTIDRTDFNGDGIVNLGDLTVMGRSWSLTRVSGDFNAQLDLNCDGAIGLGDLVLLARFWGREYNSLTKLAKTAPIESGDEVLSASVVEILPEKYAIVFTYSDTDLEGISIMLGVPGSSVVDIENIEGLSEINITREIEPGVIEINSYYAEGQFSGVITVPILVDGTDGGSVMVISSLVAETGGTLYTPSYERGLPDIMLAPSADAPILAHAGESWIDIRVQIPQSETYSLMVQSGHDEESELVSITSDSLRITSLKPGTCYQLTLMDSQESVLGSTEVTTLAAFVDDDLDPEDPYIRRGENGLFIADNDGQITFEWASWILTGAAIYEVTVIGAQDRAMRLVEGTSISIQGVNGSYYSVMVIPRGSKGEPLGRIDSRAILCSTIDINTVSEIVIW